MPEMNSHLVAERLKQMRTANGLTQAEVAEKIGVHKTTIMRWENGDGANHIKRPVIAALADIFNISPAYLLGWIDQPLTREEERLTRALDEAHKLYQTVSDNTLSQQQQSAVINNKIITQVTDINQIFLAIPDIAAYIGENEACIGLKYLLAFYGIPWQDYDNALLLKLINSELLRNLVSDSLSLLRQAAR